MTSLDAPSLRAIVLDAERDNVGVALVSLDAGETVLGGRVLLTERIPNGHKFALASIHPGDAVMKYHEVIGRATAEIPEGAHVHVHNVVSDRLPGPGDA